MDINMTGSSNSSSEEINIHYPKEATVFAAVCAILFILIGLSGNFITVLALLRCAKIRMHATTTFVLSLCVSDLLFCAFNLPLTACRYIYRAWVLGDTLCWLYPFFFYGNVAASLMSMVAITINRVILISYPHIYDRVYQRSHILLMLVFVWLFSFGMVLPPLVGVWGTLGLNPHTFSCTILKDEDGESPKKMLFILGFLLPCLTIIICYTCIFIKVKQSRKNVAAHSPINKSRSSKEDWRLTKMMLTIFLAFLLCFLPLMLVNVADDDTSYPWIHVIASVLAWASSVVNPFIYAGSNRQYRSAYKKLLCFKQHRSAVCNNSKSISNKTYTTEMIQLNQSVGHK